IPYALFPMPKQTSLFLLILVSFFCVAFLFIAPGWNLGMGKVEILGRDQDSGKIAEQLYYSIQENEPWPMHQIDPRPASGSDGVKLGDVNFDGFPDLVSGFEEEGVSRIYLNPGFGNVKKPWKYVELPSPGVEDAVLVDLDNNGVMDLVTASEGSSNQILIHWAPDVKGEYFDASKWHTDVMPATNGLSAWMFVVPFDLDNKKGKDLILGSKRKSGEK